MAVTFGLYVGCSSCCIAVNKDGRVEVVANAAGDRVTPAVVAFHDQEVVTGLAAKQGMIRHAASTVQHVLGVVGTGETEARGAGGGCCAPIWEGGQVRYTVPRTERPPLTVPAQDVLVHILRLLKEIAASHCGGEEAAVVVSVPGWAGEATVTAVAQATRSAGFSLLSTVTQPSAAVLAYDLTQQNQDNLRVVTLHCGGTTVVASLLEVAGGLITLKDTISSSAVAGNSLTQVLVEHFAKEFYGKYKGDPLENRRSTRKLYNAAENCKHVLSSRATAQVNVESLWEGVDFSTTLSRARFDGLAASTLTAFLQPVREIVERCGLSLHHVHKVMLTGGSAKIPRLQQLVAESFGQAEVLYSLPPDEVGAIGAAVEAGLLQCRPGPTLGPSLVPALATGIYCELEGEGGCSQCVFGRGTPTHSRHSLSLALASPAPPACSLLLYEVPDPSAPAPLDHLLAKVDVTNLLPESKFLRLDCHLKSDGSLHVQVQEVEAKISRSFVIEAGRS